MLLLSIFWLLMGDDYKNEVYFGEQGNQTWIQILSQIK